MHKVYRNCHVQNIEWLESGLAKLTFEVIDDEGFSHPIQVQNRNALQQLEELKNGIRNRAIFAFGMVDIDIWREKEGYRIEWSPCDGHYLSFMVNHQNIAPLFEACNEKTVEV